jgi:hypothetical protein
MDALASLAGVVTSPAQFPAFFYRVIDSPEFVQQVIDRTKRVTPGHPGAGKTHHSLCFLPFGSRVTVDRAIGAGWLI